jgi:hypothetical protein
MSIFALIVEKGGLNIIKRIKERLNETHLVKNPFIAKIIILPILDKTKIIDMALITIKPMYPNVTLFVALIGFAGFVLSGFWFFMLFLLMALLFSLFWTKYFFIFMFKVALKRGGYKGQVKILNPGEIIEKVYFNVAN